MMKEGCIQCKNHLSSGDICTIVLGDVEPISTGEVEAKTSYCTSHIDPLTLLGLSVIELIKLRSRSLHT